MKKFFIFLHSYYDKAQTKEFIGGMLLILGAAFFNLVFGYFSAIFAVYLSFMKWDYIGPMEFVGFKNYEIVLRDLYRGIIGAPYLLTPFFNSASTTDCIA